MTASAEKVAPTSEELALKAQGSEKLAVSKDLGGGRELLERLATKDTSARVGERLRSQEAVALGNLDLADTAGVQLSDTRVQAGAGVAAVANSEELQLGSRGALIQAGLGLESAQSTSLRSSAQSQAQLAAAIARKKQSDRNNLTEGIGSIVGFGAANWDDITASFAPKGTPVLTAPNPNPNTGFDDMLGLPRTRMA